MTSPRCRTAAAAALLAGLLAGCSRPAPEEGAGGGASDVVLQPLTGFDAVQAGLEGEFGCSFATERQPLLLAKGDNDTDKPAQGVVKLGGRRVKLAAPNGFDGLLKGPTFAAEGLTLRLVVMTTVIGGGESAPRPATLTIMRADGTRRALNGRWTCEA